MGNLRYECGEILIKKLCFSCVKIVVVKSETQSQRTYVTNYLVLLSVVWLIQDNSKIEL